MLARQTTYRLFLLLVVLSAVAYFETQLLPHTKLSHLPASLIPLDLSKATSLQIETTNGTIQCHRQQGQWSLQKPTVAPADSIRIDYLLEKIAHVDIHDKITARQRKKRQLDLSDFGLVPPRAVIHVAQPQKETTLRIGKNAPGTQGVFAMMSHDSTLYVIDRNAFDALPTSADDFRDRALVHLNANDVQQIIIQQPNQSTPISLERTQNNWWLRSPEQLRASTDAVQTLLTTLENAAIESFLSEPPPSLSSPSSPPLSLHLFLRSQPEKITLELGPQDPTAPENIFVTQRPQNTTCTVHQSILDAFMMDPKFFRETRLFPVADESVTQISFGSPKGTFSLQKTGPSSTWQITQPSRQPSHVDSLVADVLALSSESVLTPSAEADASHAFPQSYQIQVYSTDSADPITVWFDFPDNLASNAAAVVSAFNPTLQTLHPFQATTFPPSVRSVLLTESARAAYRDTTILSLDPQVLTALAFHSTTSQTAVYRSKSGHWLPSQPTLQEVNTPAIDAILALLADFSAAQVVSLAPQKETAFGLNPPAAYATFSTQLPDRPVIILLLSQATPGLPCYAKIKGEDAIFLLTDKASQTLLTPLFFSSLSPTSSLQPPTP